MAQLCADTKRREQDRTGRSTSSIAVSKTSPVVHPVDRIGAGCARFMLHCCSAQVLATQRQRRLCARVQVSATLLALANTFACVTQQRARPVDGYYSTSTSTMPPTTTAQVIPAIVITRVMHCASHHYIARASGDQCSCCTPPPQRASFARDNRRLVHMPPESAALCLSRTTSLLPSVRDAFLIFDVVTFATCGS